MSGGVQGGEGQEATAEGAEGLWSPAAQQYAVQARLALDRSELMLRAAEELADSAGLADVRRRVGNLVTGNLKPSYVGLALLLLAPPWEL